MYEHVYTLYEHVCTQYVHGTYQASPFTYWLSQQVFVANTEMEYGVISLFPLLQGRKMLMLTLPFMVRDLIAPEVHHAHV